MPFTVNESDVENAEEALGVPIPVPLRSRLMRDNGGEVEVGGDVWELFKVLDRTDRKRLARTAADDIVGGLWQFQSRRRTTDKPQSCIAPYAFVAMSAVFSLTTILVGPAAWL